MAESKPIGIRTTLWLAIALTVASTLLGASALRTYDAYHRAEEDELLRARTIAESHVPSIATWLLRSRDELSSQMDALPVHADLCLMAVLAPDDRTRPGVSPRNGATMKLRGDPRLLERFLREADAQSRTALRIPLGASPDGRHHWPDLYLIALPIKAGGTQQLLGTFVCGVRSTTRVNLNSREVTVFVLRLLLIAAAGGFMGFWWLKRTVVQPLAALADESARSSDAKTMTQSACARDDEIGALARALADMHMSLDEWRERAVRLERSMNHRVASETQRVARELQLARRAIWIDPLTQLGNRQLLEDQYPGIYAAQQQAGSNLCLIMLDVDNFKNLNDTRGHAAGDELLRFIGELLRQSLREGDFAIRYGGDEFILILPSVPLADAQKIAQRTILLFNQQSRLLSVEPRPGLSAGVASIWEHKPSSAEELLQLADQALYEAKSAGKACVRVAEPGKASNRPIRRSLQVV
jgi:diguanylate cyclase (GGDEF)-like protein